MGQTHFDWNVGSGDWQCVHTHPPIVNCSWRPIRSSCNYQTDIYFDTINNFVNTLVKLSPISCRFYCSEFEDLESWHLKLQLTTAMCFWRHGTFQIVDAWDPGCAAIYQHQGCTSPMKTTVELPVATQISSRLCRRINWRSSRTPYPLSLQSTPSNDSQTLKLFSTEC